MIITAYDHWLFVCSANLVRSPTAEYVARGMGLLADSCGTNSGGLGCKRLTWAAIEWATVIVCMQAGHVARIKLHPKAHHMPIYCWNLPDDYGVVYQPDLVKICQLKLADTIKVLDASRKPGRPVIGFDPDDGGTGAPV